jgi:hypothetical protein
MIISKSRGGITPDGRIYMQMQESAYRAEDVVAFLRVLLRKIVGVWNLLKRRELKNLCCLGLPRERRAGLWAKERLRHRKKSLQACFLHALEGRK